MTQEEKMTTRRLFLASIPALAARAQAPAAPRPAPELNFTDVAGKPHLLSQYRGKVVLLEFLLTTCPHCQNTARLLGRLDREFGPKGFLAIGAAFNDDAALVLPEFVKRHQVSHLVTALPRDTVYSFAGLSTVVRHTVPILMFIDRAGMIRATYEGDAPFFENEEANIRSNISRLLGTPQPRPSSKAAGRRASIGTSTRDVLRGKFS
jgi:thiol-disulfide isomerase/thioredoxin